MNLDILKQMDLIFFFYGLAFVLLAAICSAISLTAKAVLPWRSLFWFGLIHGLNEWLDMLALDWWESDLFRAARTTVMALSFVCLLDFGRGARGSRGLYDRRWFFLPFLALGMLGLKQGLFAWNDSLRYALGFPGGLLAGYVMVQASRRQISGRRQLFFGGVMMGLYGLAAGIVVPKSGLWLAGILNYESFRKFTLAPIQLVRAVLATGISVAIWQYSIAIAPHGRTERRNERVRRWGQVSLLVSLLVGGVAATQIAGSRTDTESRADLLSQAIMSASAINPQVVKQLRPEASVENSPGHVAVQAQLRRMREAFPGLYQYVYLLSVRNNQAYFLAGSEPTGSVNYNPPGFPYSDAPIEVLAIRASGQPITVGPYKDRWGNWISAFVPVFDEQKQVIAIFGMDRSSEILEGRVARNRLYSIGIMLALILVALVGMVYEERNHNARSQLIHLDKITSIGILAAGVAHEINNPLGIAQGNLDLLAEELPGGRAGQEPRATIQKISHALERVRVIVAGLRNYARVDSTDAAGELDMHEVIRHTLLLVGGTFKKEGAQIISDLQAQNPVIMTNAGKLEQVLMNLLTNALHATEGRADRIIRVSTSDDAAAVALQVSDNGCGISEEHFGKIFTPFFTTKPPGKGTGLGLSTCQMLIRAMGGSISVESAPNEGAAFTIRFERKA